MATMQKKPKIQIKLCGFSEEETTILAAKKGAKFLGFVFYEKSPRFVKPRKAREISQNLSTETKKVAVMVDPDRFFIAKILQDFTPDFLQIHKSTPKKLSAIKAEFNIPIIAALTLETEKDLAQINSYEKIANYLLFDAKTKEIGGAGKVFDWNILKNLKTTKPWFLSGGLNIENIATALEQTGAKMIDLSSGIEERKGVKSASLINELMGSIYN